MRTQIIRLLGRLAGLALFVSGCAGPGEVFEVVVEPASQNTSAAAALDAVRPVLDAVMSGSLDSRRAVLDYVTTACTTAEGLGGPPKCLEGESDGTLVEVFPTGGPESSFVRQAEIDTTLSFTVKGLYAVYKPAAAADQPEYWPAGEYALLFDREQNDYPLPIVAIVQAGRLVRLDYHVGVTAAELLSRVPVEAVVVPPQDAHALTGGSP